MKNFLLSSLLVLSIQLGQAQNFPSEIWHEGRVVLMEGDTLRGQVMYNLETDLVQFTGDDRTIKTFTARKLLYFEIFDNTVERYREFYTIPYSIKSDYKTPVIFEVLTTGKQLSLLSREALEYQVSHYPYGMSGTYSRLELVYTNYFLLPDGTVKEFGGKKKDLLWMMNKRAGEMKKFIKSNRIKMDDRRDLAKAVAYYNSLFQ